MVKRSLWIMVLTVVAAACGGTSTEATSVAQEAATDLSGVGFEVHQEPG